MPRNSQALFTVFFLLCSLHSHAITKLNGLTDYSELENEKLLLAVYSSEHTSRESSLLSSSEPTKLEVKVTTENGISARRFSKMWIEGIAINNHSDVVARYAELMLSFTSLLKHRLHYGDQLTVTLVPHDAVYFHINGDEVGREPQTAIFPLLMSAWVGDVPLSPQSKQGLLLAGEIDPVLLARYNSIKVSSRSLFGQEQGENEKVILPKKPMMVSGVNPIRSDAALLSLKPKMIPEAKLVAAAEITVEPVKEEPTPSTPEALPAGVIATTQPANKKSETPEARITKELASANEEAPLTVASIVANHAYLSEIKKIVGSSVKYPRRSIRLGEQGSVRISVLLDREGRVLDSEVVQGASHWRLNSAALKAVKRAGPFPSVPEAIAGDTHRLSIPVTFVLAE